MLENQFLQCAHHLEIELKQTVYTGQCKTEHVYD